MVAYVLLTTLFSLHLKHGVDADMVDRLDDLAAGLEIAADGTISLTRPPDAPKYERQLSGQYWQIETPDQPPIRSRSLWDARLPGPSAGTALGEIGLRDVGWIMFKELRVGLILGVIIAIVAYGRAALLGVGADISLVVAITILAIAVWSATVAAALPLLLRQFRIDPAIVSAPFITTLVDGTGLIIYFEIARFVLAL
jgi:hypothetical protein